jgi:hypothetical protein
MDKLLPSTISEQYDVLEGETSGASISQEESDFIAEVRKRYTLARDFDREDMDEAINDQNFVSGEQWSLNSRRIRELTFQPVLTWNRLHKFVDQVVNDARQNNPAIRISPSDKGTKETAELIQGRIRQIEYESDADEAYDTSADSQVSTGRGFYRVATEYSNTGSFRQVARIKAIPNQMSVLFDPAARKYDRSDADYCFLQTVMSRQQYRREFGNKTKMASMDFFANEGNPAPDWISIGHNGEQVMVAEYWVKEYKDRTLCRLMSGETKWKDELDGEDSKIEEERTTRDWEVVQYIVDGCEVLSRTEWVGKLIPVIPVWGREETVRGKRRTVSLIRYSHDAQRLVNLYVSNIAGHIMQAPKSPFVIAEGQLEGHEDEWEEVNNIPRAALQYKPTSIGGLQVPPPIRDSSEPPIQALSMGLSQALDALKASCGIYDTSLGNAPPDASGLAIQRRNTESDMGNYHFADNQNRSRKLLGRILLELLPHLDGDQEAVHIRDEEGKTHRVPLNTPIRHTDGGIVRHNLNEGDYLPHISTGPSYTSQRQEAATIFSQLAQTDKGFMSIAGDLLFRSMDIPGADQLADRYQKMLPPQLLGQNDPNAAAQKLSQAQQMIHQLSEQVHTLHDEIKMKQPELDTRRLIAEMQEETKRQQIAMQAAVAEATLQTKANTTRLQEEMGSIQHSIDTDQSNQERDFDALLAHYQSLNDQAEAQQGQQPSPTGGQ